MFRIRPIRSGDFGALENLAFQAQLGMTNLPKNNEALRKMHQKALASFDPLIRFPGDHYYLFVLESAEKEILGVSAIYAQTGINSPLEYFQLKDVSPIRIFPEVPERVQILERVQYRNAPSEICSLFLTHDARKSGLGKLLSLSRFLFMRSFPERFCDSVFADMRGVIDRSGKCPFWDAVGYHFLKVDFTELMARRDRGQTDIDSLMPIYPLYIDLLPLEAKSVIGETHPNTKPALAMLINEGFSLTKDVDLYDAGPRVLAKREEIKSYKNAKILKVSKTIDDLPEIKPSLLSNLKLDFRATFGKIKFENSGDCVIDRLTEEALEISSGEQILFLPS